MKKRISISHSQSVNHLFNRFLKQYRLALETLSIGEMLTSKQILTVLAYLQFIDDDPLPQDIELSKTIAKLLASHEHSSSITRLNFFKFLVIICDIQEQKQFWDQEKYFNQQTSAIPLDTQSSEEPLILIKIGEFDQMGRWNCTFCQKQQLKEIFKSMRLKRISRGETELRKKQSKDTNCFKPKICNKSMSIAQKKLRLSRKENRRVQNRLLESKEIIETKIAMEVNRSKERQLAECTFKPKINSKSVNKQNHPSNSQQHLKKLLKKGEQYYNKREKLKEIKVKLNESAQLEECTFKPNLTKQPQTSKWVYVRNQQKEVQRLREGRKHRQFMNCVKQRGYPEGVRWSDFMNSSKMGKSLKQPILCIDLKIMNSKNQVNVFQGDRMGDIAERISRQNKLPPQSWNKVETVIRKAIEECGDVYLDEDKIFSSNPKA